MDMNSDPEIQKLLKEIGSKLDKWSEEVENEEPDFEDPKWKDYWEEEIMTLSFKRKGTEIILKTSDSSEIAAMMSDIIGHCLHEVSESDRLKVLKNAFHVCQMDDTQKS